MSHHRHGKDAENNRDFRAQSYFRLLSYVRPYWKRLTLGILAGMLVGGSLFFCLMMIPQLVGVVDGGGAIAGSAGMDELRLREQSRRIAAITGDPKLSAEEREEAVRQVLRPAPDKDPKLSRIIAEAKAAIRRFHLPMEIEGTTAILHWPSERRIEIVSSSGTVAWQLFAVYVVAFILFWALKCAAHYLNGYCTRYVGSRVVADLRSQIFRHLSQQSLRFYGGTDIGHLISRSTNDTTALEHAVSNSIEDLTNAPLQILGCLAAILVACRQYNSYALVFILLIGTPVLFIPIHLLGRLIRKVYKKSFARVADVFSRMHEVFSGILVVKAYHAEERECVKFNAVNNRYFKQVIRAMRLHILVSPLMELVAVSAVLVFLVFSFSHGVTITELTALLAPAMMAYRPIKDISKVVASIQQAMAAADRFFSLLDTHTELPEKADAVELDSFNKSIELRRVSFSYAEQPVLRDISLSIPKGAMVAVVGETGSGKSTIANLIARFYDPDHGSVSIDGIDLRDCTAESIHRLIGVVTQDPVLFNDTIAANIAYGKPDATREEIEAAAKLANAHDFIVHGNHTEGYDTEVGERGFKLSGGEKQRIAIARAILCNPPILILDEATSALDTVTEKLVQEALNRVMKNRTVFAIAHRLSTIRNADRIIVMSRGTIAESGTEEELLRIPDGIYRNLHATQYQNDEAR